MADTKLHIVPTISEAARIMVRTIRQAGWLLVPPLLLDMLLGVYELRIGEQDHSVLLDLAVQWLAVAPTCILMILIARAGLDGSTGRALVHVDRQTLKLFALLAVAPLITSLIQPMHKPGWLPALSILDSVFTLAWLRATLVLQFSWALGDRAMTFSESWRRLSGNFIRVLFISMLVGVLLIALVEAGFVAGTGRLGMPGRQGWAVGFGISSGLVGFVMIALDAAIYRFLGRGTALAAPPPGHLPALNAFDA